MDQNLASAEAVVTESTTCGICLEDSKDPLSLPCGHMFCDGCLNEWRSRYGVKEEMRKKCPICRARIPPSNEMVKTLRAYRAKKQQLEDNNDTSSEDYHVVCGYLKEVERGVGADWDGVTVLQDNDAKPAVVLPDYIAEAIARGKIRSVLRWINAHGTQDCVNATSSVETLAMSALSIASVNTQLTLMTLLLQLGANVDVRDNQGLTALSSSLWSEECAAGDVKKRIMLLLSWGASFFLEGHSSKEVCIHRVKTYGEHKLAQMIESELGGRRCEIVNLSSRPKLNGTTCVADEYLPGSNQYKVTLETKSKEVLVLGPDNLKRRDRTPEDCGYYIEFKNGRIIRHDFDSNEDCQAFVVAMKRGDTQPVVTEESEAAAEQAAAELLAELGIDDSPNNS